MESNKEKLKTKRRGFLGAIATGAAAMSIATFAPPLQAIAHSLPDPENGIDDPDAWFKKLIGKKHKIVFDATRPHEVFPFAWPAVFMMTNEATATMAKDQGIVVVLRHTAISYAFEDRIWAKYNFGEVFKAGEIGPAFQAADKKTAVSTRNPFWKPKEGDFKLPGVGNLAIGINDLQSKGIMFCVCNTAITVYSAVIAQGMNMKADDVKKDWMSGLLPGIEVVPSGVWALGRAQENGCAYCFAG